jgi:hypothetical protein
MNNLTGQKFNLLTVIKISGRKGKEKRILWQCSCDCGNTCHITSNKIKSGETKSCGCLRKLKQGESAFNILYGHYKYHAKKRNLDWNLNKINFKKLTKLNCYYCGIEPSQIQNNKTSTGNYIYNGVDRILNKTGYNLNNCVPCCKTCNWMKNNININDFINHINKIYINLKGKNERI